MLFSIITVCFNSGKTIERTLQSILSQTYQDYEYIIVDGGSTDDTLDIVKRYETLFGGRMKWKSEPDSGIFDAFNKGVRRSSATYLWIVNSDDYAESDALEKVAGMVQGRDIDNLPVISGTMRVFEEKTHKTVFYAKSDVQTCRNKYEKNLMGIIHPATLVPRYVYEKVGLFNPEYRNIGDYEWFHRMYSMDVPIIFTDSVLTNLSNGGTSNQLTWKHFMRSYDDRKLFFATYYKNFLSQKYRLARWCATFLRYMFNNRKRCAIQRLRATFSR